MFVSGVLVQVDPPGGIGSAVLGCSRYARVLKLSILARIEHFFVNFAPLGSVSIERVWHASELEVRRYQIVVKGVLYFLIYYLTKLFGS